MSSPSRDISKRVFKRVQRDDMGEFSMDSQMLATLIELDGEKTVAEVARNLGVKLDRLKPIIFRLLDLNLIESVEEENGYTGTAFFKDLYTELSLAVGPIAEILIEDAVIDLGQSLDSFSMEHAPELVDMLARQIKKEEKRMYFRQVMVQKIKKVVQKKEANFSKRKG